MCSTIRSTSLAGLCDNSKDPKELRDKARELRGEARSHEATAAQYLKEASDLDVGILYRSLAPLPGNVLYALEETDRSDALKSLAGGGVIEGFDFKSAS
jgi:hypothetical protein